ncbi:uncharacterized protein LOC101894097 [Musca domestica]|uniref:Uncharacterized protein LOC101894097 n=1 Tax=Musca domestica TaxID=7370 RepID=A0A9J7CST4_MUSDO|nr:uncharacterized protein LOC101894097 [Musca domestica]
MDIFQRTLHCHTFPPKEEEIEVFEAETEEQIGEEEHDIPLEEEPLDLNILMKELECMKRHIQKLQLHLKTQMEECPKEEECVDLEVLLKCSENKEICSLQKNQNKVQCQINEIVQCCRAAKDHITDLRSRFCETAKELLQQQKLVANLVQWKNSLDHEFGKCLERFEYLKHVKAEWKDVKEKLQEQKRNIFLEQKKFVSKKFFDQEKQSILGAIGAIKEMFNELVEYQLQRFECLEKRIENISSGQ